MKRIGVWMVGITISIKGRQSDRYVDSADTPATTDQTHDSMCVNCMYFFVVLGVEPRILYSNKGCTFELHQSPLPCTALSIRLPTLTHRHTVVDRVDPATHR